MEKTYTIIARTQTLQDSPKNIDFHIHSGDYFLHLATLVGVLEEAFAYIENQGIQHAGKEHGLAREIRNDLRYIHANYKIIRRTLDEIQMVQPAGNLLPG